MLLQGFYPLKKKRGNGCQGESDGHNPRILGTYPPGSAVDHENDSLKKETKRLKD